MLACLTRRGSPFTSPSVPGPPRWAPGSPSAGIGGNGPAWRDSSHGGPEVVPGRGEATGVIGVVGSAGPVRPAAAPAAPDAPGAAAAGVTEPPATLRPVHPGNGAGWSG